MPRLDVFAAALRALDAGRRVAIATVIGAHGSTPRHLGARMAVAEDGEQWGTIGGGKIEQLVVAAAREVAAGAVARVVRQHLVRDLAMCCGGSMEIVLTPAAPSRAALEQLTQPDAGASRILVTPIDGEPLEVRPLRPGDPVVHRAAIVDDALVERAASERAIVFGLGHVARNLGPLLAQLGYLVIVCDDGETGAVGEVPAWASRVIESFDVREVERELDGFLPADKMLIVTRDHAIDQQLLEQLIVRDDLGYLGMIGSRGKVGRFRKRLEAKGLLDGEAGAARWARLRAPIGLDVGAETPEEIAVAIAAELIALRRRGAAEAGDWRPLRTVHAEAARVGDPERAGEVEDPLRKAP
jgi:xanthine dehydrogenase accessory factor